MNFEVNFEGKEVIATSCAAIATSCAAIATSCAAARLATATAFGISSGTFVSVADGPD